MKPYRIIILISVFFINSCKLNTETDNKSVFNDLVKKYPELYANGCIDDYIPVRKFYNNIDSVEMQLFEAENHSRDKIVIISNNEGRVYAVPFPDNNDRAYWRFEGETKYKASNNKTFDAEMNKAFETLSLKENWEAGLIFNDIFVTLMQALPVFPRDSSTMKNIFENPSFPDSCKTISKNNFQDMINGISATWADYNTFDDLNHYRFVQFEMRKMKSTKISYKITVYRDPCVVEPLYL